MLSLYSVLGAVFSQCLSIFAEMGVFVNGNDILNPKLLAKMLDSRILNKPDVFSFNFQITFCSYSSYIMPNVSLNPCLTYPSKLLTL